MPKRILIIGGVAGGASCAARLRRLDEHAEIQVFDRGPYVSFANCGLPYFVGDVIRDEGKLLVATPELFHQRFAITVHVEHEVLAIDRVRREITVLDKLNRCERREAYDALVLSPGAAPIRPAVPGLDLPGIFSLRTIPDSRQVRAWIEDRRVKTALVVGGGFIGLEMAENLRHRGLAVTLLEKADQVMPPLDRELAAPVQARLAANGVSVRLGEGIAGFAAAPAGGILARTDLGAEIACDLVILAIGVRPETALARACGLELGPRGGIKVDAQMRSSDPAIYAVGDVVESSEVMGGQPVILPLAGPANRQGRVAAEAISGRQAAFRGVQSTAVCGLFGLTVASTGAGEKNLRRSGSSDWAAVWLHPGHHVGYYPGARPIHLKLLYRPSDGRILGAQAVGEEGVEKRIDVIAMAIQMRATVHDLAEAELCYAPQFGAAKDPVNLAGMIAANALVGDAPIARWDALGAGGAQVLDVREPAEWDAGHLPQAIHIPLGQLRGRLEELDRNRPIQVHCAVGQRAYYAVRLLRQHGFDARNLSGGWATWKQMGG